MAHADTPEAVLPPPVLTDEEAELARAANRCLVTALDHSRAATIALRVDDGETPVLHLPPKALRLVAKMLGALGERKPFVVLPPRHELTTVEVANMLNVSRPFVIKEIEAGRLEHRMVGTHRRVAVEDVRKYQAAMKAKHDAALQGLADDEQELGLL